MLFGRSRDGDNMVFPDLVITKIANFLEAPQFVEGIGNIRTECYSFLSEYGLNKVIDLWYNRISFVREESNITGKIMQERLTTQTHGQETWL